MGANDPAILAYAEAVRRMRALPANDPRSWEQQALVHQNFCPHGNWWFLPWHRAYLHRFEEICRGVLGDDSFALPYWNWSRDSRLPAAFLDPSSPLFQAGRLAGPGDRAEAEMVDGAVIQSQILPETDFTLFGGGAAATQRQGSSMAPLEAQPHNHVHVFVGGVMATFMSPRDPIFWLHHANVDRIWEIWNRRGNVNTNDATWRNLAYGEFVDRNGSPLSIPTADMESIGALGYSYDSLSVAPGFAWREPLARLRATTQGAPFANLMNRAPRAILRTVNDSLARPLQPHVLAVRAAQSRLVQGASVLGMELGAAPTRQMLQNPERVVARIGDMVSPQNQNVVVRVFVNCDYLSPSTPTSDPHYAGSFGFFCGNGRTNCYSGEMATTKDISQTLRRLQGPDYSAEDVRVQLMPVDLNGRSLNGCEFYARTVEVAVI